MHSNCSCDLFEVFSRTRRHDLDPRGPTNRILPPRRERPRPLRLVTIALEGEKGNEGGTLLTLSSLVRPHDLFMKTWTPRFHCWGMLLRGRPTWPINSRS